MPKEDLKLISPYLATCEKLEMEKTRLESSNKALTIALNASERKMAEQEKIIAKERQKAVEEFIESKGFMDESNAKLRRFGREYVQKMK